MVELLLETRKLEHRLCEHCDHTFRAQLHVPTLGANNAILRNRYLLAEADNMPVLERSRASTQKCLAELEREIEGLQKALQWSLGARAEVKHLLDVQDAYFAPVRKLPIEILSEIFILCCGKSTNLTGERCAPLDLSAVCKVWRDTMLDIPEIWSNFKLCSKGRGSGTIDENLLARRLKAFLAHSRDLPLPQCVQNTADTESNLGIWNAMTFEIFLQYSHRWTALRVIPCMSPISDALRGRSLSCLTTLKGDTADICEAAVGGLFMIPTLRCLKLTHYRLADFSWPDLPWMQIEELHAHSSALHAHGLLSRCPNVKVFYHNDTVKEPLSNGGLPIIVLPRLRHLSLFVSCEASLSLLGLLVTPALEVLSLDYAPMFLQDGRCHIERLVARSSCHLQRLYLKRAPEIEQECILSLSDLTRLDMNSGIGITPPRTLLEELGAQDSNGAPRVLTRLQTLHLQAVASEHELLTSALEEAIVARRAMGFPLKATLVCSHPTTHRITRAEFT